MLGRQNKILQADQRKEATGMYSFTLLGAVSPRSGLSRFDFLRALCLAYTWPPSDYVFTWPLPCVHTSLVLLSPSYKDTSPTGLGPHIMFLNLSYLPKRLPPKIVTSIYKFGSGYNSAHNRQSALILIWEKNCSSCHLLGLVGYACPSAGPPPGHGGVHVTKAGSIIVTHSSDANDRSTHRKMSLAIRVFFPSCENFLNKILPFPF